MKKYVLMTILMAIVLLLSVSIASATLDIESVYTSTTPTFGGTTTMASNPNADAIADENIYINADVTLNSTGATTVASITVTPESGFSNTDSSSSGYINITLTDVGLALLAGTSTPVTINARIPERLDAVDSDMDEVAIKVATLIFTLGDASYDDVDVYMQRKNMLEITDLDVSINGDSEDYDDGDDIDDTKPGDDIIVEVVADNNYDDDDDDVEIEDVELTVLIDDNDLDVDEDDDMNDIDPDDDATGSISFTVEEDANDESYDMEIFVDGDDEHGAKHGEKWTLDFNVERQSYETVIKSTSLSESTVSCTRGSNSVSVKLYNIGKKDDDEIALYVTSSALGIDYELENMEIDESDTETKTISFSVSDDLAAGTYPIRVKVYYSGDEDDGVLGDLKDLDLVVQDCAVTTTTTTTSTTDSTVDVVTLTDDDVATLTSDATEDEEEVTESVEKPFTESWLYATILIAGVVVALGFLVFLILKFLVFV